MAATLAPDRVQQALAEFKKLNTREAKAAFADYWIGVWAQDFEYAWPMLYELLNIVKEDKLYADPKRVGPGAPGDATAHGQESSYKDFAAYFEDRVKRPWQQWAELEATYQYAAHYAKDLLKQIFGKARDTMQRAIQAGNAFIQAKEDGLEINKEGGRPSGNENLHIMQVTAGSVHGTNAEYLARRIARDRPDVLERMAAGEFRSVRAAAIEAGIAPRTMTIPKDDAESAFRRLTGDKGMDREQLILLAELLKEHLLTKEN